MRRTFKIRFYCRPAKVRKSTGEAPVECSIIINGDRQMITLPRSCNPSEFPTQDLALYLDGVRNKINGIYTALSIADEPITAFILKDIFLNGARKMSYTLKDMFEDGLKLKASQNVGVNTYNKYVWVRTHFFEKTKFNENREAGSVTHSDILFFKSAMDAEHKPQTVEKEMMRLKYFFLLAWNSGKIRSNPFAGIKIKHKEEDNVYLTQEEIGRIRSLEITNDTLDRVRDAFLFMCYSGLEYADMIALQPEDFSEKDGMVFIRKKRVKTGVEYVSVLYEDAIEIRKIYGSKIPMMSNQKLNKYLAILSKNAKIDKSVTTITARHSYAMYLVNIGLPFDIVSKMLGHTSTKQTKTYASILDESVLRANLGVSLPKVEKISSASLKSPRIKKSGQSGQDWDDTLEWFRNELGL